MRMTEDDDPDARGDEIDGERRAIVDDMNGDAAGVEGRPLVKRFRPVAMVDVAAHGDDRRDRLERAQDCRIADVAGMDDGLDAAQRINRRWPEQAVRV
jgi:hypothetical protein